MDEHEEQFLVPVPRFNVRKSFKPDWARAYTYHDIQMNVIHSPTKLPVQGQRGTSGGSTGHVWVPVPEFSDSHTSYPSGLATGTNTNSNFLSSLLIYRGMLVNSNASVLQTSPYNITPIHFSFFSSFFYFSTLVINAILWIKYIKHAYS